LPEESRTPGTIAFIGLGQMGLPMSGRLAAAGMAVRGFDMSEAAMSKLAAAGGQVFSTARQAAEGADVLITMLPNSKIVRDVLLGDGDAAGALAADALVIDMSSSAPLDTRALGKALEERGIRLIDAPVSGGVARAREGSLAIMLGGEPEDIERARGILAPMGTRIFPTGKLGSGHAMKALNNYVSAAGLVAACEALIVGAAFGLEPATITDVLNASTGRNNSTELKLKQHIISGTFGSGFGLALLAKDIGIAADLADEIGRPARGMRASAEIWTEATAELGEAADHTEIYKLLADGGRGSPR